MSTRRAICRGPPIERQLSRRELALREKTLWRMLYETAARASEILALNVEDLDLDNRRASIRSKGGQLDWVYWGSGTAYLLPRLIRLPDGSSRTSGIAVGTAVAEVVRIVVELRDGDPLNELSQFSACDFVAGPWPVKT